MSAEKPSENSTENSTEKPGRNPVPYSPRKWCVSFDCHTKTFHLKSETTGQDHRSAQPHESWFVSGFNFRENLIDALMKLVKNYVLGCLFKQSSRLNVSPEKLRKVAETLMIKILKSRSNTPNEGFIHLKGNSRFIICSDKIIAAVPHHFTTTGSATVTASDGSKSTGAIAVKNVCDEQTQNDYQKITEETPME